MEYSMSILLMYSDASDGLVGMIFEYNILMKQCTLER